MSGPRRTGGWLGVVRDGAGDLLLGAACWSCGAAGRAVCADCAADLAATELRWAEPVPEPVDFPPTVAAAGYDGVAAALIRAHKDDQAWALRPALGERLAAAVRGLLAESAVHQDADVVLVPVPSSASAVRRRGYDATGALADHAAKTLRRADARVSVLPLLRQRAGVVDQAGLDARERADNLRERLVVRRAVLGRERLDELSPVLILVDDVTTTGSTLAEAVRALRAAGRTVHGAATVAATRRRGAGSPATDRRSRQDQQNPR